MNASSRAGRWLPLAVFGLLALLLGAGVWLSRRADRDALPSPLIGKAAPAFSLPVLHEPGRMLTLDQLKGQPFVLYVWASWCVSCRVEHPVLTRFAETRRVRVVGNPMKFAESQRQDNTYPPAAGEHTEAVLKEILNLSQGEIDGLVEAGAVAARRRPQAKCNVA